MKKLSVLALVLAFTMMLSVVSFAAATFNVVENADVETQGSVIPAGTTVVGDEDSIAVTTAATAGNYYGILLVEGNALPTVDNAILYINQATAADVTQAFEVLPNMTDLEDGTALTLYISSNVAGANLIAIPMIYKDETVVPDVPVVPDEPVYIRADVDNDGEAGSLMDAAEIVKFQNFEESVFDNEWYTESVAAILADVDLDGDAGSLMDAAEIVKFQNFEESVFDRPPYTE